jgi:hypothetical protein
MKPFLVTDYKDIIGIELADWHLTNHPVHRKQGKKYKEKTFFLDLSGNPVYYTATLGVERLLYNADSL